MEQEYSKKSRAVAAILAFLIGMLGVHRFYVGKPISGVAMILLTISFYLTWVSVIWVVIDFILILVGKFKDKEGKLIFNWNDTK